MPPKSCVVKLLATPEEKRRIAASATASGMSMSAYARELALGHKPASLEGLTELEKVFKIHADLGRLGGLLKMLLSNEERLRAMSMGKPMAAATIEDTLLDIHAAQESLRLLVEALTNSLAANRN